MTDDRTDRTDENRTDRTESGVRHAGCSHLARPGSRCRWCGTILPSTLPPALPARRRRKRAS